MRPPGSRARLPAWENLPQKTPAALAAAEHTRRQDVWVAKLRSVQRCYRARRGQRYPVTLSGMLGDVPTEDKCRLQRLVRTKGLLWAQSVHRVIALATWPSLVIVF